MTTIRIAKDLTLPAVGEVYHADDGKGRMIAVITAVTDTDVSFTRYPSEKMKRGVETKLDLAFFIGRHCGWKRRA